MNGVVKHFNGVYGFITAEDRKQDVFLHADDLPDGLSVCTAMAVEFEVIPNFIHPKNGTRRVVRGSVRLRGKFGIVPKKEAASAD
jgi:cold shock CspA family protein